MNAPARNRLDAVLDRVRSWPSSRQEDALRTLLAMESEGSGLYELSDEERADIDAALEEMARGEVASDDEVAATFAR